MLDTSYSTIQHAELLKIWVARYIPDLATPPSSLNQTVVGHLKDAIAVSNRQAVADAILQTLVTDCAFAGIKAQKICLEVDANIKLLEVKDIGVQIITIYKKLLRLYIEDFVFMPVLDYLSNLYTTESKINIAIRILPGFHRLNQEIDPLLQQLQEIYLNSSNHREIGFLTTISI